LYRLNVRLKYTAVPRRFNSSVNFDILSKIQTLRVDNCTAYIVNKHIEEQGPQDRSVRNTGENFKR
jgi:hypothetical protein